MLKFRTQLLTTTAILALSGAAYAADMPVKAPPPAPVPYVANWTGWYVGAQIGGASFEPSCHTDVFTTGTAFDPCHTTDFEGAHTTGGGFNSGSVIGGGKIGADYQWDRVVLGIVGEFDWMNLHGGTQTTFGTDIFPGPFEIEAGSTLNASARIDWIASLRGRIGWAFGNFLAYGTGGVAWTQIKTSVNFAAAPDNDASIPGEDLASFSGGGTSHKTGGVAGAGFEYMVAPHVSVVGEVLWYGFGSSTVSMFCPASTLSTAGCGAGHTYTTTFDHQDVVTGTLGVNWRF